MQPITHVAWSCDGKKLAAVGIDRMVRVFQPEKSVRRCGAVVHSRQAADRYEL